jgi:hypothetical protein
VLKSLFFASAVDKNCQVCDSRPENFKRDPSCYPRCEVRVLFSHEISFIDEEENGEGEDHEDQFDAFEYFLPQEGDLGVFFELGARVEKDLDFTQYLHQSEMAAHHSFGLYICPIGLIEYLLKVDAFFIRACE